MAVVKPKDKKMISNRCSLSHLCVIVGWVCVWDRESHSLFILVSNLTITYQGRHLYESLITLVPLKCGDFSLRSTRRVNLNSIVGTVPLTYNGGLTSMNLHDFIILMIIRVGGTNISVEVQWNTIHKIYKWIHSEVTNTSTQETKTYNNTKWCEKTRGNWSKTMMT